MNYMDYAIEEANKALKKGEIPVGAIVVKAGIIIGKGYNEKEGKKDPTQHAEIIAIKEACANVGDWRLTGCEMYVTLEPCPMCAGAILQSRISRLYIGSFDPSVGACGSVINIIQNDNLNHWTEINWLYNEECGNLLTNFFKDKR